MQTLAEIETADDFFDLRAVLDQPLNELAVLRLTADPDGLERARHIAQSFEDFVNRMAPDMWPLSEDRWMRACGLSPAGEERIFYMTLALIATMAETVTIRAGWLLGEAWARLSDEERQRVRDQREDKPDDVMRGFQALRDLRDLQPPQ